MSINILSKIRSLAFSYLYIQAIVILCITILLSILTSKVVVLSFLWGGIICIVPNAYFAYKFFAKTGAQAARQIIAAFYVGEMVKFIITIALFLIVFKFFNTNKLAIFIGYIVAQITFWVTALIRKSNG